MGSFLSYRQHRDQRREADGSSSGRSLENTELGPMEEVWKKVLEQLNGS